MQQCDQFTLKALELHQFMKGESPFENTGVSYKGQAFQAYAYTESENEGNNVEEDSYNFYWKDFRASWYISEMTKKGKDDL